MGGYAKRRKTGMKHVFIILSLGLLFAVNSLQAQPVREKLIYEYKGKAERNFNKRCYVVLVLEYDSSSKFCSADFYFYNCFKEVKIIQIRAHVKVYNWSVFPSLEIYPYEFFYKDHYFYTDGLDFCTEFFLEMSRHFTLFITEEGKNLERFGYDIADFTQFSQLYKIGFDWIPKEMKQVKKINYRKIPKVFHDFFPEKRKGDNE